MRTYLPINNNITDRHIKLFDLRTVMMRDSRIDDLYDDLFNVTGPIKMSLLIEMYGENNIQSAIMDRWLKFVRIRDSVRYSLPELVNKKLGDYNPELIPDRERLLEVDSFYHPTP